MERRLLAHVMRALVLCAACAAFVAASPAVDGVATPRTPTLLPVDAATCEPFSLLAHTATLLPLSAATPTLAPPRATTRLTAARFDVSFAPLSKWLSQAHAAAFAAEDAAAAAFAAAAADSEADDNLPTPVLRLSLTCPLSSPATGPATGEAAAAKESQNHFEMRWERPAVLDALTAGDDAAEDWSDGWSLAPPSAPSSDTAATTAATAAASAAVLLRRGGLISWAGENASAPGGAAEKLATLLPLFPSLPTTGGATESDGGDLSVVIRARTGASAVALCACSLGVSLALSAPPSTAAAGTAAAAAAAAATAARSALASVPPAPLLRTTPLPLHRRVALDLPELRAASHDRLRGQVMEATDAHAATTSASEGDKASVAARFSAAADAAEAEADVGAESEADAGTGAAAEAAGAHGAGDIRVRSQTRPMLELPTLAPIAADFAPSSNNTATAAAGARTRKTSLPLEPEDRLFSVFFSPNIDIASHVSFAETGVKLPVLPVDKALETGFSLFRARQRLHVARALGRSGVSPSAAAAAAAAAGATGSFARGAGDAPSFPQKPMFRPKAGARGVTPAAADASGATDANAAFAAVSTPEGAVSFLEARAQVVARSRHTFALSAGWIMGALVEGLTTNSVSKASRKMQDLHENYVIPDTVDIIAGAKDRGGDDPEDPCSRTNRVMSAMMDEMEKEGLQDAVEAGEAENSFVELDASVSSSSSATASTGAKLPPGATPSTAAAFAHADATAAAAGDAAVAALASASRLARSRGSRGGRGGSTLGSGSFLEAMLAESPAAEGEAARAHAKELAWAHVDQLLSKTASGHGGYYTSPSQRRPRAQKGRRRRGRRGSRSGARAGGSAAGSLLETGMGAESDAWNEMEVGDEGEGEAEAPTECPVPDKPLVDRGETNEGPGLLGIQMARNILSIAPLIVKAMGEQAAAVMATDLHAAIVQRVEGKITHRSTKAVIEHVVNILQVSVPNVVSIALVRLLPAYLLRSLTATVTQAGILGATHAISATLSRSLSTSPQHEGACYQCAYMAQQCETCFAGDEGRTLEHVRAYYTRYFAAFYGEYYANYYVNNGPWSDDGGFINDGTRNYHAFPEDPTQVAGTAPSFDPANFPTRDSPPPMFPHPDDAKAGMQRQLKLAQSQLKSEEAQLG